MRLDKALASSGYGTRSEVKNLIAKNLVTVNGVIAKDPGLHVTGKDTITVKGQPTDIKEHIYLMFDKPDEVVTAMEDKRLTCVGEFIPQNLKGRKISPVGRLDYHTTGLLILTNDGELSHRLTSPIYGISKEYLVTYHGPALTQKQVTEAQEGITLTDMDTPVKLKSAKLKILDGNKAILTLTEGKTHEVRRIFAKWERPVKALRRISVGPLKLDTENPGALTELTGTQINSLKEITKLL